MIYLYQTHISTAFTTKLRGYTERLIGNSTLLVDDYKQALAIKKWCLDNGFSPVSIKIVAEVDFVSKDKILLDIRANLIEALYHKVINTNIRIIFSANHFMCPEPSMISLLLGVQSRLTIILENIASKDDVFDCYGLDQDVCRIVCIPPVIVTNNDLLRFEKAFKDRQIRLNKQNIMTAGVIMYHKPRHDRWWQKRHEVLDYFPARTLLHNLSNDLGFDSYSMVVEDNSKRHQFWNKIKRRLEIDLKIQQRRYKKYYSIDIVAALMSHDFFFAPQDIFSVVPQFAFHAMRAGLIIIGSDEKCFTSLGFIDGVNYISIGEKWDQQAIEKSITRCKNLTSAEIDNLRAASRRLLTKLDDEASISVDSLFLEDCLSV